MKHKTYHRKATRKRHRKSFVSAPFAEAVGKYNVTECCVAARKIRKPESQKKVFNLTNLLFSVSYEPFLI